MFVLLSCSSTKAPPPLEGRSRFSASQLDDDVKHAPQGVIDDDVKNRSDAIHSFLLGEIELRNRNPELAIEHFSRSSTLFSEPTPTIQSTLADLYLNQGTAGREQLELALNASTESLATNPDDSDMLYLRASLSQALDRPLEAENDYRRLLAIAPANLPGSILLGLLLVSEERDIEALTYFDSARKPPSDSSLAMYLRGSTLERMGNFREARKAFEDTLKVEPKNPYAFLALVRVLAQLGLVPEIRRLAEETIKEQQDSETARRVLLYLDLEDRAGKDAATQLKGLTSNPLSVADIRFRLALSAMRNNNSRAAMRELRLVLAEDPQNADARYNIAAMLSGAGDTESAVKELALIDRSSPMFVKARTFAAFLLRQEKQFDRAEDSLREALSVEAKDPQINSFLIVLLREAEKFPEALSLVKQQLDQDPNDAKALFNYATIRHEMKDEKGSFDAMERVIELDPNNSDALNFVAFALAERGESLDRAEELVTRALTLRPNDGYYLDTLGWIHFKRNELDDAEPLLMKAVQLSGDEPEILEHYGDVLLALGRVSEAASTYRRALERIQDAGRKENDPARTRIQGKLEDLRS